MMRQWGSQELLFLHYINKILVPVNDLTLSCIGSESEIDVFESVDKQRREQEMVRTYAFALRLSVSLILNCI